jgi:hypothetical protein
LRLYGTIEMSIGAWALIFPWLFAGAQWLSVQLPIGNDAVSFGIDVILTTLLIGPPTVLTGGTIPILTQSLSRRLDDATRVHAWIYGFNTLGSLLGALLGGYALLFWLYLYQVFAVALGALVPTARLIIDQVAPRVGLHFGRQELCHLIPGLLNVTIGVNRATSTHCSFSRYWRLCRRLSLVTVSVSRPERSTRPGRASVKRPWATRATPPTNTCSIPFASA